MSKFIDMYKRGTQHQDTSGRGCTWYAGQSHCYRRHLTDIRQACPLVEGIKPEMVIADKVYSVNSFRKHLDGENIQAVIPPIRRGNRSQITYDAYLYKVRHLIENAFLNFKQWRAIAIRYAKRRSSFLAVVQVHCIALWCKIF